MARPAEEKAGRCPIGCGATLGDVGRFAPYRVCRSCGTGVTEISEAAPSWAEGDEPTAEQVAFWSGRQALWNAVVGTGGGRRLVDVGCGFGHFLAWARDTGWDAWGVEPDGWARERSMVPDRVAGSLDDLAGSFDQATLWDVLEHVTEPVPFLSAVRDRLSPGGSALVCSPHFFAMKLRWPVLRRNPARFDAVVKPHEHVVQFSRRGLRLAMERAGFVDVGFRHPPPSRVRGPLALAARVPGARVGLFAVGTRRH